VRSERAIAFVGHAIEAMVERGISTEWVERTVLDPTVVRANASHSGRKLAFRRIPEHGGRWLRVVYEEDEGILVVTTFFDRGMKE